MNYNMCKIIESKVQVLKYCYDKDNNSTEIYEAIIEKNIGTKLCREAISEDYIIDAMDDEFTKGFVLKSGNDYVGMILYTIFDDDTCELKIIGTNKNEETKGLPIGQYLLYLMEEDLLSNGVLTIFAHSLILALDFYYDNGWEDDDEEDQDTEDILKIRKKILDI